MFLNVFSSMSMSATQAERVRDGLIKTIYVNLHNWIVQQINKKINPVYLNDLQRYYIGILDMPGFGGSFYQNLFSHILFENEFAKNIDYFTESFPVNSFEQLIINFANEAIQNFSLKSVVKDQSILENSSHTVVIGEEIFKQEIL